MNLPAFTLPVVEPLEAGRTAPLVFVMKTARMGGCGGEGGGGLVLPLVIHHVADVQVVQHHCTLLATAQPTLQKTLNIDMRPL